MESESDAGVIELEFERETTREASSEIIAVPVELFEEFWTPQIEGWIRDALLSSCMHELSVEEVFDRCKYRNYLMLQMLYGGRVHGVLVLARSRDPIGRAYVAVIVCAGLGLGLWLDLMVKTVKQLAREIGAREIVVFGRPGWRRVLRRHGLKLRQVTLLCDLEDDHG